MSFVLAEAPEIPEIEILPEDTELEAVVQSAKVVTTKMTDDDGSPVKQVEFAFSLVGPEHSYVDKEGQTRQRRVFGRTSTTFSTSDRCRLRNWVTEIMAADELPVGFRLDLDDLVDHPVRVILKVDEWDDRKAPIDPATGQYPKRRANKVKDLRRSAGAASSFATGPAEEPF